MRLKALLSLIISLFFFTQLTKGAVFAAEISPEKLTISDDVYADLALRHELDRVSIYYFDNNIDNIVSINAEKNWVPASTIKLFVAMYAFDQAAAGNLSFDQQITIQDKNVVPSPFFPTGYPPLHAGDVVSVYELLDRMITQSGNVSYNTLLDILDRGKITTYIHDLGLVNSSVGGKLNLDDAQQAQDEASSGYGPNATDADDYARAFILINGKRIPGSAGLFDMLARQKSNNMIPALLPKDVLVAHKTGELDPYYHDGGIVVAKNRRYILSVFSNAGDPGVVAHISDLVYTKDESLIGSDTGVSGLSEEEPNAPIDPLVASGKPQQNVLAESSQKVSVPTITASDLGIVSTDLSSALSLGQLPKVIIPVGSPLHILIDLGDKITSLLSPTASLRVISETGKLKLKLAEANDLIIKGRTNEANTILQEVDKRLTDLAKEKTVSQTPNLQLLIDQVSETRFSILKEELVSSTRADRTRTIKEIARQAKNATEKIYPSIKDAIKTKDLSQKPVLGEIVNSTSNFVTVKTEDGSQVTTPLGQDLKIRKEGDANVQIQKVTQIPIGTKIAIVGSFILTNVSPEVSNSKPVIVLKVNPVTNTLVIASENGTPVQVDLTKKTVIKGANTSVSFNDIKTGDLVVVRGIPLKPAPGKQTTSSPSASSIPSSTGAPSSGGQGHTQQGQVSIGPVSSPPGPSNPSVPAQKISKPQPQVIKGSVIQVIEKASELKPPRAKKEEKKAAPNPIPSALPPEKEKK